MNLLEIFAQVGEGMGNSIVESYSGHWEIMMLSASLYKV